MDRNAIGRESKPAVNEIEKGAIRRFAESIGESNPIYFEEHAARAAGYRSVVAPPTFPLALRAGSDLREGLVGPGKQLLQAEQSFEYARPIVAGDRLTVTSRILDVNQRPTPSGTPTEFVVIEHEGRDDEGNTVYRSRQHWVVRSGPKHAGDAHE